MPAARPASDLVVTVKSKVGCAYVLGTQVPKNDPNASVFDCAELASWGVFQVIGELWGCTATGKDPARADAYSGAWARDAVDYPQHRVDPTVAAATPGGILIRTPGEPGMSGHVAISQGGGKTVEAYDTKHGVIESTSTGRRWDHGFFVPGLVYDVQKAIPLTQPKVLRLGSKGDAVKKLQEDLKAKGFDPGTADGVYGSKTARAVAAFQSTVNLVPDGEAGPLTLAALEATASKKKGK